MKSRLTLALIASSALIAGASMASAEEHETATPADDTTSAADETTSATDNMAGSESTIGDETVEARIIELPDWHPDLNAENSLSVESIIDMQVEGPTGEDIGQVANVLFDEDGSILSLIAEIGGVWDIGDTHVSVPWDEVRVDQDANKVILPVTQDTVEDYTLFTEDVLTVKEAAADLEEVEGDNIGVIDTGPRVWRASELIGDYVRMLDDGAFAAYGYVDDIFLKNDKIAAVAVRPDATFDDDGLYTYPYYGYDYGWWPGAFYYDLPYDRAEIDKLEPVDET